MASGSPPAPMPERQPACDRLDDLELAEVVGVVDPVVASRTPGSPRRTRPVGSPIGAHRGGVDDEVVVALEELVDEALGQPDDELARELRRAVGVVEELDVEVGGDDEPVRPWPGLIRLHLVDLRDERAARHHRGEPGHTVLLADVGHEVLDERTDALDDSSDDRSDGRTAGNGGQGAGSHAGQVGVEVDEVVPPVGVGQVGAAVRGGDEDDPVDPARPARAGQLVLDEAASRQAAPAVRDDVDDELVVGLVRPEPLEEVPGVLAGVDAQGPVVESDDRVVRADGGSEQSHRVLVIGDRAEATGRRRERAVDEQQDADGTVGREVELL